MEWRGRVGRLEETSRSDSVVCFDWTVLDIFSMPERPGAVYYGPELEFGDSHWFCGLYPSVQFGVRELLGVELWRSSDRHAFFSLGILKADGTEDVRLPKQMFPENCRRCCFDRFLSKSELLQCSSVLAPLNNLTIRCTLWKVVPFFDEGRRSMSLDSCPEKEVSQADRRVLGRRFSLDSVKPGFVLCSAKEEEVAQVQFIGRKYFSSDTLTNSRVTRSVIEEEWTVVEAPGVPSNSNAPVAGSIREEEKNLKKHVEWDVDFDFLKKHGHVEGPLFDFGEQSFFLELCLYWRGDVEIQLYRKGPSCSSTYCCWGGLKYADGTYPRRVRNLELDLREERCSWKIMASLGDFCKFDLESRYLDSKRYLTAFVRLKVDGESSMDNGLIDACVQADEYERAAERIERLRQLFKLWLEHPEEAENIRQICKEDFKTRLKKSSTHLSKPDEKYKFYSS